MKRIIILLCAVVLLLGTVVSATETLDDADARHIPDKVLEAIDLSDTEYIYQIFRVHLSIACTTNRLDTTIEDILNKNTSVYIQKRISDQQLYRISVGEFGFVNISKLQPDIVFYQQTFDEISTGEAIKSVSPDIRVLSVYYLWGENNYTGTAIYYKTNLGDYVYYRQTFVGELLFPAETFILYQNIKAYGSPTKLDLSAYNWRSPDFDPDAPLLRESEFPWLIVGISAAAAVTTVLIIRKKKKKTVQEEIEPTPE